MKTTFTSTLVTVFLTTFFHSFAWAGNTIPPVRFSTLQAEPLNNSVSLIWNVAAEENLNGYVVERSTDGISFTQISFVPATGRDTYSFVDNKPSATAYYRIRSADASGKYTYSPIAIVNNERSLKAFPVPTIGLVTIQHDTAATGSLLTISSEDGRIIKSIVPATGAQEANIDLSSAKAGLYLVRYVNSKGDAETMKIVKQ